MLYTYQREARVLERVTVLPQTGWVHAVAPSDDELALLRTELKVPDEFLRHALDVDEVARVDRSADASLVMIRVPWREAGRFRAAPIGVVLLPGLLVTITKVECDVLSDLLKVSDLAPGEPHRFLLQLVLCTAERFLAQLRTIDREVARLEDELQSSLRNEEVLGLLEYQKGLVHFTAALASNRIMLERLQKDSHLPISPEDHDLLEDALVEIQQAIEMATISESVLGQMMDAFASLISNNLNAVMKVLTALTIVLTIPMLVSSFYGMNVDLPGADHPFAFAILVSASVLVGAAVVLGLRLKRWI